MSKWTTQKAVLQHDRVIEIGFLSLFDFQTFGGDLNGKLTIDHFFHDFS